MSQAGGRECVRAVRRQTGGLIRHPHVRQRQADPGRKESFEARSKGSPALRRAPMERRPEASQEAVAQRRLRAIASRDVSPQEIIAQAGRIVVGGVGEPAEELPSSEFE